jgi:hypothetical protein
VLSRDSALSLTFYLNFVFICSFILTLAAFKTGAKIISVKKRRKTIERCQEGAVIVGNSGGRGGYETTEKKVCVSSKSTHSKVSIKLESIYPHFLAYTFGHDGIFCPACLGAHPSPSMHSIYPLNSSYVVPCTPPPHPQQDWRDIATLYTEINRPLPFSRVSDPQAVG